jgi:intracellular multiplication protein IcmG
MVNQVDQEEEYHFQDLGQTSEPEVDAQAPEQNSSVGNSDQMMHTKKRVYIAAGGAFLLVVVYNLVVGLFGGKKDTSPSVIKKVNKISSNKSVDSSLQPPQLNNRIKPKISRPQVRPRTPATKPKDTITQQAQQAFEGLNRTLRSIEVAIKDLDSRIIDLQANQSKIQKQFDARKKAEESKLKEKSGKNKKHQRIPISQQYEVIGVIHGRAWLKASRGSTLTVRSGDKISGYGSVKMIEPEQGVVIMSSGEVIKFKDS